MIAWDSRSRVGRRVQRVREPAMPENSCTSTSWSAPKIREKLRRLNLGIHTPAISTVHALLATLVAYGVPHAGCTTCSWAALQYVEERCMT